MSGVKRVFVEKKKPYAVKAKELHDEITGYLGIKTITDVRELIRYDIENLSDETYEKSLTTVFSEPPVDNVYEMDFEHKDDDFIFSVEFLPGQFDQRADSAEQCVKFFNENEVPVIKTAVTYVISGKLTEEEKAKIKELCINPVDSREASSELPKTLVTEFKIPDDVIIFDGFKDMQEDKLRELYDSLGLAMTFKDFKFIQEYFHNDEKRNPSMTEIRVLDTYWSDHCRHTTFATELKDVQFKDGFYKEPMQASYNKYLADRNELYKGRKDKFVCLMDLALLAMKKLKAEGKLADQEESDEINACSIVVPVDIDGKTEEWLVNFKNETHNHPTEIESFGGAATCLGGAIRDPLSGRTYVYQAMRITGAADPTVPISDTLHGKLPQRKLVTGAAQGYSSYGNQIGLATGYVKELYHPDYVAKRMEIGAVIAAAPRSAVKRENSDPGDIIVLLGGRTGRDGCGGATGSSKVHTEQSLESCGAEVQKGNAPTERKMQRLFRRPEVTKLVKKCNDFGAGGVSVAIGELADGLKVSLDKVPKKYEGLDGTELAISESQERMAVVLDPKDVKQFLEYAEEENLEAVEVAVVTKEPRLVLEWRGKDIVNISRAFLDTNGAHQETSVLVDIPDEKDNYLEKVSVEDVKTKWLNTLSDLNECSQKGLVERFDGSIGAGSVYMPYGGKYQLTETQSMVAKLPVLKGKCDTVTMMAYGFDPYLSKWSPYHGAMYAVTDSVAKIVAAGGDFNKIRFTFHIISCNKIHSIIIYIKTGLSH
jgi:phosphoribosylformylglycinamidine synthase